MIVRLLGDTSDFDKKMGRARGSAARAGSEFGKMSKPLKTLGSSFMATAAGAAAAYLSISKFMGFMQRLDDLGKAARTIGITSAELSKLQYAASLSGVSNINSALQRYQKNIGDVKLGTGEAAVAFKALGINVREFTSIGVVKQLEQIADKIKDMGKPDQLAILTKIFGRQAAAEMASFFEGGAEGIRKMTKEAERLGVAFDDKLTKSAERFNDALTTLYNRAGGITAKLLTQPLEDINTAIADSLRKSHRNEAYKSQRTRKRGGTPWYGDWSEVTSLGGLRGIFQQGGAAAGKGWSKFTTPGLGFGFDRGEYKGPMGNDGQAGMRLSAHIAAQSVLAQMGLGTPGTGERKSRPKVNSFDPLGFGLGINIARQQQQNIMAAHLMGVGAMLGGGTTGGTRRGSLTMDQWWDNAQLARRSQQDRPLAANTLIEGGTAEAFRQLNKRQGASDPAMKVQRSQLKTQEKSEKHLEMIEKHISKLEPAKTVEL